MRQYFSKLAAFILICTVFFPLLAGCSQETQGKTFRYDIPSPVTNLDPQYATDSTAIMIISNIFEGLLVSSPDGALSPGVATSYNVSDDGLTYTFTLREDAKWSGDEAVPVTAHDFVFTFRRMFNASSPSPFAVDYIHIKNAENVLSGLYPPENLGVQAKDNYTFIVTLEQENSLFPELLAASPAMPCNKEAYEKARGRYGLEPGFISANGPFRLSKWTSSQITLAHNNNYASEKEVLAGDVVVYIGREDPSQRFIDGTTDLAILPYSLVAETSDSGLSIEAAQKTTWCIVFNQNTQVWGNPFLRKAFAHALDYDYLSQKLTEDLAVSGALISPASMLGGKPFRSYTNNIYNTAYDPENAVRLFQIGLDMLGYESLPRTTFLVPNTEGHLLNMGLVQQSWQKNLSAYINIQPAGVDEIERRFASGDYEVLLMPFSPAGQRVENLLSVFTSGSSQNRLGYKSAMYDQLLSSALDQPTAERMAFKLSQAETAVLSDAVVIPVYFETTYYAFGKDVSGIEIQPFGNRAYFKYAVKS